MFELFKESLRKGKIKYRLEQQEKHLSEIHRAYQEGYSAAKQTQLEKENEERKWEAYTAEKRLQRLKEKASPFGRQIAFGKYED